MDTGVDAGMRKKTSYGLAEDVFLPPAALPTARLTLKCIGKLAFFALSRIWSEWALTVLHATLLGHIIKYWSQGNAVRR